MCSCSRHGGTSSQLLRQSSSYRANHSSMTAPIRTKGNKIIRHVLTGCKDTDAARPSRDPFSCFSRNPCRMSQSERKLSWKQRQFSHVVQQATTGRQVWNTTRRDPIHPVVRIGPICRTGRQGTHGESVRLSTNSASFAMEPLALFRNRQHDSHSSILINSQFLGYGPIYIVIAAPMGYSTAAPLSVA